MEDQEAIIEGFDYVGFVFESVLLEEKYRESRRRAGKMKTKLTSHCNVP